MVFKRRNKAVTVNLGQAVYKTSGLTPIQDSVNSDNQGLFEVSEAPVEELDLPEVVISHNSTKVIVKPSRDGKDVVITVVTRSGITETKVCELSI